MSLTKEAIQHLEKTALTENVQKEILSLKPESPVVALPNGVSVESLERYMEHRTRYRADFDTKSIDDFVMYCQKFDQDGATCFINGESMNAVTILDMGTQDKPLHKEHKSCLYMKKTALFSAVQAICFEYIGQKAAAEFIEDWQDSIQALDKSGQEMSIAMAVKSLQDLTIEQAREINSKVDDFGEGLSVMEKIEAKNKEKLVSDLIVSVTPYYGMTPRSIRVRVGYLTGGEKPKVSMRILQEESLLEDVQEEFKEILTDKFKGNKIETYLGTI